jgi:hypothetical protein
MLHNMEEAIIRYYRRLMKEGFKYAGKMENPDIFVDAVSEGLTICDQVSSNSLQLFIRVRGDVFETVRYLCVCDPTTNVAVEILGALIEGKTIAEAEALTIASFSLLLGSESEDLSKKAKGLIELLHRGIKQYRSQKRASV